MSRVALITGGMGGIGSAICQKLADQGMIVATTYTNASKAKDWHRRMHNLGYSFHEYHCDVTDFDQCQSVCNEVIQQLGSIDILVNNAGITRDASLRKQTKEQWDAVINTNLNSLFNITKPVVECMLKHNKKPRGRIINISSINGQRGQFGQTNYAAAKAGVHGFTKSLSLELASKDITVNTISPGYIETEMVTTINPQVLERIIAQIPVGRLGTPLEVAEAVAFLASVHAGFITGSNLAINGGMY